LFWTDLTGRVANDIPGALVYLSNWQFVLEDVSYFETFGRPPVLRHLWSLAIEEQFYVVWPLVFLGGMAVLRRVKRFGAALATVWRPWAFQRTATRRGTDCSMPSGCSPSCHRRVLRLLR
jgi:peptidoglycan/LPS O-acetylase OafA/YrhL